MRKILILSGIIAAFFMASLNSYARDWSNDQKAVWSTIQAQWEASKSKDYDKWGSYVADDFIGWSNSSAMPRNKADILSWERFSSEQSKTLKYQLDLLDLVVHGDAAIAHYYYVLVSEDKDGKRKFESGRWSDTLARDGKNWKFIGWQGGQDKDED